MDDENDGLHEMRAGLERVPICEDWERYLPVSEVPKKQTKGWDRNGSETGEDDCGIRDPEVVGRREICPGMFPGGIPGA